MVNDLKVLEAMQVNVLIVAESLECNGNRCLARLRHRVGRGEVWQLLFDDEPAVQEGRADQQQSEVA